MTMMMMMMVVVLPVRRFSSHLSFAALLSLGGGSGYVQFDCLTTLHKSTAPTLTDSDDVLLSDEDFPILLLSFVDFFCTHFQSLRTVVRIHLVYITTFSRLNMSPNPTPHIYGPVRLNCVHQLSVY